MVVVKGWTTDGSHLSPLNRSFKKLRLYIFLVSPQILNNHFDKSILIFVDIIQEQFPEIVFETYVLIHYSISMSVIIFSGSKSNVETFSFFEIQKFCRDAFLLV